MNENQDLVVDAGPADAAAPVSAAPVAPAEHVALTEVPGAPLNATEDVKALLPKDGSGGSMITVMLALIAVGGGGAAWKFYQTFAKQKHEEKMKELELQAGAKADKQDDDKHDKHDKCATERVALEAKVSTLEARLAEAEKAAKEAADAAKEAAKKGEVELPFDAEELQDRLAKLEKILVPPAKRKPGRPKKNA